MYGFCSDLIRSFLKKYWQERRNSERVSDDSTLLVSGYNKEGLPFAGTAKINDVSLGGISFFIGIPVEKDEVLDIAICSDSIRGVVFSAKARVLRVSSQEKSFYPYLIATKFERDFVEYSTGFETQDVVRLLEEAIELDEQRRSDSVSVKSNNIVQCDVCGTEFEENGESVTLFKRCLCLECRSWEHEVEATPIISGS